MQSYTVFSHTKDKQISIRLLAIFCCILVVVSLLPLFVISFKNHPYYDDFAAGGQRTKEVWDSTQSVWALLVSAVEGARDSYHNWEGNYITNYVNAIQIAAISQDLYFLISFVLLAALAFGSVYIMKVLLHDVLDIPWSVTSMAGALMLFLSVQFIPAANEAFFWQSGGIKYTLGHVFLLLLTAETCKTLFFPPRTRVSYGRRCVLLGLLAILCTGSNLMTGLGATLGLGMLLLFRLLWSKKQPGNAAVGVAFLSALAGYGINIMAPGNFLRQAVADQQPPMLVIVEALEATVEYIGRWSTLPWLVCLVLLTPLVMRKARKSRFRFSHPLWFLAVSFAVLASQLAPPIYTGVYYDTGRIVNTMYLSFCVFIILNWWYGVSFIAQKSTAARVDPLSTPSKILAMQQGVPLWLLGLLVAMLMAGCAGYGLTRMSGVSAFKSLVTGQAERYHTAYQQRTALLEIPDSQPVILYPMEDVPMVFMEEEPAWPAAIQQMSMYYGKDIIDGRSNPVPGQKKSESTPP